MLLFTYFYSLNHQILQMSKKVILVTGASSGIGKQIALHLSEKHTVYGTSRSKTSLTNVTMLQLDLANVEGFQQEIEKIIQKEGKIDVLVNNAGVGITGPLEETSVDAAKKAFQTNVFGTMELTNLVLPYLRKQQSGQIIFITSIAGYMGLPFRGYYSASKAALISLVESLAMEVKSFNIHVNSIAPGDFATNIASGRYTVEPNKHSPYRAYQTQLQLMNEHVDQGEDPIQMAYKVASLIEGSPTNIHYKVGSFLQKFSIVLKRILPDFIYQKMLMNHYKL